ncbi:AmmeMemoRadiSam system protein B [Candidatus Woesearchaeota archaeon]|nr:AmmeMemoRadiSam system protein B [Candidatus Woesearchaeota archaeon]
MRNPVVSGAFYESDADKLKDQIKGCFLSDFGPRKLPEKIPEQELKGIIVPHAGYLYSGPCAAYCYKAVAESKRPDLFIILGVSHSGFSSCLSMKDWQTPLGTVKVDKEFGKALIENGIPQDETAHANEHSIEVQLPFLQFVLKDFKFIPIIVSDDFAQIAEIILKTIEQTKKNVIIIASSDFTHYGAEYGYVPFAENIKENLYKMDAGAIEEIKKMSSKGFLDYVNKTGATICGKHAIAALLNCLKSSKAELLKYYTSADISNKDYSMAVGYAAIKFRK